MSRGKVKAMGRWARITELASVMLDAVFSKTNNFDDAVSAAEIALILIKQGRTEDLRDRRNAPEREFTPSISVVPKSEADKSEAAQKINELLARPEYRQPGFLSSALRHHRRVLREMLETDPPDSEKPDSGSATPSGQDPGPSEAGQA